MIQSLPHTTQSHHFSDLQCLQICQNLKVSKLQQFVLVAYRKHKLLTELTSASRVLPLGSVHIPEHA